MNRLVPPLLAVWLFASGARSQPREPFYLGEVRPQTVPKRVVSLAPSLTEILFALGIGEKVVGVTSYDDFPEQVKSLPRVGGFINPCLEAILGLSPDLVVCVPNSGERDPLLALVRMGVPVLVIPAYEMEDIFTAAKILGDVFGQRQRADGLVGAMLSRIDKIHHMVKDRPKPRVLLIYGHRPFVAAGSGSFADSMLQIAGGENVIHHSNVRYPAVPMEEIIQLQPEVIVDASSSGKGAEMTTKEADGVWDRLRVLPAVKNKRVYIFDSAIWFRPGPRVMDGLEKLVKILHPGLFHVEK